MRCERGFLIHVRCIAQINTTNSKDSLTNSSFWREGISLLFSPQSIIPRARKAKAIAAHESPHPSKHVFTSASASSPPIIPALNAPPLYPIKDRQRPPSSTLHTQASPFAGPVGWATRKISWEGLDFHAALKGKMARLLPCMKCSYQMLGVDGGPHAVRPARAALSRSKNIQLRLGHTLGWLDGGVLSFDHLLRFDRMFWKLECLLVWGWKQEECTRAGLCL